MGCNSLELRYRFVNDGGKAASEFFEVFEIEALIRPMSVGVRPKHSGYYKLSLRPHISQSVH